MYWTQFLMFESLTKFIGRQEPATARARSLSPCFCCSAVHFLTRQINCIASLESRSTNLYFFLSLGLLGRNQ